MRTHPYNIFTTVIQQPRCTPTYSHILAWTHYRISYHCIVFYTTTCKRYSFTVKFILHRYIDAHIRSGNRRKVVKTIFLSGQIFLDVMLCLLVCLCVCALRCTSANECLLCIALRKYAYPKNTLLKGHPLIVVKNISSFCIIFITYSEICQFRFNIDG